MLESPTADFCLLRSNHELRRSAYQGYVVIPQADGTRLMYDIEADVHEYDVGDGTKAKRFEGRVLGGQLVREPEQKRAAKEELTSDWVQSAEEAPFDDPLPEVANG